MWVAGPRGGLLPLGRGAVAVVVGVVVLLVIRGAIAVIVVLHRTGGGQRPSEGVGEERGLLHALRLHSRSQPFAIGLLRGRREV